MLAHKNPRSRVNQESIETLGRTLVLLELDEPAWSMFSVTKARLELAGHPIMNFDILLASVAMTRDLTLVTNNEAHYRPIGVRMENWVAGLV